MDIGNSGGKGHETEVTVIAHAYEKALNVAATLKKSYTLTH